jgi:hypothetical protein
MVTANNHTKGENRMDPQLLSTEGRLSEEDAIATPGGYVLPDIDAMLAEVGATYPLMGYAAQADEQIDDRDAFDAVIFAGLITG